jgi:DNA-binding MarR family transcriptional regulator
MEIHPQTETIFRVFNEIGIIHQLVRSAVESALPGKMRSSHFGVLNHFLSRPDEISPGHLAKAFQVTNAAMTNTLGKMQTWGFVDIRKDPDDSRAKLVSLTDAGRGAHVEAAASIYPVMRQMLDQVDLHVLLALEPGLKHVRETLDAARD